MTEPGLLGNLRELQARIGLIRHEVDRGPAMELIEKILAQAEASEDKPFKETSPAMATLAAKYVKVKGTEWYSLSNTEQLKIIHKLAGSVLSQFEPPAKTPKTDGEGNSD